MNGSQDSQDTVKTVLVVEDEDAVRNLLRTLLRLSGYEVLSCQDGAEALDLLAARGGEVNLLITDINLGPGMDGFETAEALRQRQPSLKVLYISGEDGEGRVAREMAAGASHFLTKPFTPRAFTERVRLFLDAVPADVRA
jgi:CheY-like chemotaxis protein